MWNYKVNISIYYITKFQIQRYINFRVREASRLSPNKGFTRGCSYFKLLPSNPTLTSKLFSIDCRVISMVRKLIFFRHMFQHLWIAHKYVVQHVIRGWGSIHIENTSGTKSHCRTPLQPLLIPLQKVPHQTTYVYII